MITSLTSLHNGSPPELLTACALAHRIIGSHASAHAVVPIPDGVRAPLRCVIMRCQTSRITCATSPALRSALVGDYRSVASACESPDRLSATGTIFPSSRPVREVLLEQVPSARDVRFGAHGDVLRRRPGISLETLQRAGS